MRYLNKVILALVLCNIMLMSDKLNAETEVKMINSPTIDFRESWRIDDAEKAFEFQKDGSIFVNDRVGYLFLPKDYQEFIAEYPGGITPTEEDNFIVAQFKEESIEVQVDYLISLESLISDYSFGYESIYADGSKSKLPPLHIIIASGSIDDFVLNVDKKSPDFGKVYNWTRSGDPWGTGDNTEGLGWVANSFTDFLNNLKQEAE